MRLLPLILLAPALAHASWFEAGIGTVQVRDMGDGVWVQQGAPQNRERLRAPAYLAGLTGDLTEYLAWHADYVYFGGLSASCLCVPDESYNTSTHQIVGKPASYNRFNGQGHTQGVMLTLEPHTTYHGVRFGVEAGPWLYWSTWHEVAMLGPEGLTPVNASHRTAMQFGAVAGVSAGVNGWRVSYRYFYQKQKWNPYPGLQTGTHMLMLEKKW